MITIKVDEDEGVAEVNGMKLCDMPLQEDEEKVESFGPDCICNQCPNFNECENGEEEDGGCEDDGVEEDKEASYEKFMDETIIKFLVLVFSDMSSKGVVELYKATKSFVQDRDKIEGAALSKVAALEAVKLLEDVRIAIYMDE